MLVIIMVGSIGSGPGTPRKLVHAPLHMESVPERRRISGGMTLETIKEWLVAPRLNRKKGASVRCGERPLKFFALSVSMPSVFTRVRNISRVPSALISTRAGKLDGAVR